MHGVVDRHVHAGAADLGLEPRDQAESVLDTARDVGVDVALLPLLRPCSGPASRSLSRTDRQALGHNPPREPPAPVVVGNGQHCTGVALGQLATLDHRQHVIG